MDKLMIFHKICKDDNVKITDLIKVEITPTYNQLFLVSGGTKNNIEINYLYFEDNEVEESI